MEGYVYTTTHPAGLLQKRTPGAGLAAAPGVWRVLQQIVAIVTVNARRDHVIVNIIGQPVGTLRLQKTMHPFG